LGSRSSRLECSSSSTHGSVSTYRPDFAGTTQAITVAAAAAIRPPATAATSGGMTTPNWPRIQMIRGARLTPETVPAPAVAPVLAEILEDKILSVLHYHYRIVLRQTERPLPGPFM